VAPRLPRGDDLDGSDATFQDLSAKEAGAIALIGDASLDCLRCSFLRDQTTDGSGDGGALFVDRGVVTLTDSVFADNASNLWFGGAISLDGSGEVHVYGGSFSGNTAGKRGGAIVVRSDGTVTVDRSPVGPTTFDANAASADGGAIACDGGSTCSLTVTGGTFAANVADGHGGALYVENGDVTLTDAVFTAGLSGGDGGAVAVDDGSLTVVRGRWCDNQAGGAGGAVRSSVSATLTNVAALRDVSGGGAGAFDLDQGAVIYASFVDDAGAGVSAVSANNDLLLAAAVLVGGSDAVAGSVTVVAGSVFDVTNPYDGSVDVQSSVVLATDPFLPLDPAACDWPIPVYQGDLVDVIPADQDPDGTDADAGATGGPDADPDLWADQDGDGLVAMWDCDDADPSVVTALPDCETVGGTTPTTGGDTGTPATTPAETASDRDPGKGTGSVGCGCDGAGAPPGLVLALLVAATSRRSRSATSSWRAA
jgi:predicted outer membrane repeat protein